MVGERQRRYPRQCPICWVAMIGEKSTPESEDVDIHRCFNCGCVIDLSRRGPKDDEAE
jgi:hypothetical protein